jgi:hypothetical protein
MVYKIFFQTIGLDSHIGLYSDVAICVLRKPYECELVKKGNVHALIRALRFWRIK